MDPLLEQFNKAKEGIHLSSDRKKAIRGNLVRFIEADLDLKKKPTPRYTRGLGNFLKMPVMAAFMIMLLVGGGTSLAAEKTVPGDILYPIKVAINEPVVSALSLSAEAKIDWEAELAERRLKEALKLADAGKLDPEVEERLSLEFTKHETKVQERISNLEESGDEKVAASLAARFEGSLKAHEEALRNSQKEEVSQDTVLAVAMDAAPPEATMMMAAAPVARKGEPKTSLKEKVASALSVTAHNRLRLEGKIESDNGSSTERAAEERIKTAIKTIGQAKSYATREKNKSKNRKSAEIKTRLETSDDLVAEAKIKTEEKLYGEAFNLANAAARVAQESKTSLEVQDDSKERTRTLFNFQRNRQQDKSSDDNFVSSTIASSTSSESSTGTGAEVEVEKDEDIRGERSR